jgi:putative ABC transport system substrate-binding protein
VIVAINPAGAAAAKSQTTTIPIVFAGTQDPVVAGLVASLARPGGNVTGPSLMLADVAGKRLQMLSEIAPGLARVAVIFQAESPGAAPELEEAVLAGKVLGIDIRTVGVRTGTELLSSIASVAVDGAQAIYFPAGPILANDPKIIANTTLSLRLPAISDTRAFPDAGGLLSYGANLADHFRRSAYYVDRILKGAKPADLPVEQPTVFDLVINKRTADALGLTIPPKLMILATEIIE